MSIKVMIIDASAEYRALLGHHVSTHWPEATVSEYDPAETGHLPKEFSGAGNDVVLLGNNQDDRKSIEVLRQYLKVSGFPPVVMFGEKSDEAAARRAGVSGFLRHDAFSHDALAICLSDAHSKSAGDNTRALFLGEEKTGIAPRIRGYRFVQKLSVTTHSAVYLAEQRDSARLVVLKVLRQIPEDKSSADAFDRFLQEYELIADLSHPNIVRIHDLGVADDHAHIAMEYLDGGDLRQRISDGIEQEEALSYLRQIAAALAEIHKLGILHRDLKPGNIMLRADDSIALIDFGLAKRMRLHMEITDSGEIFGTPYYMSPEQGHGNDIDERSDVYSLGVIFYEMLTGEKPFRADSAMGIIFKHAKSPVPILPRHLVKHQTLLSLMMAKSPDDRLQSATEVLEWL